MIFPPAKLFHASQQGRHPAVVQIVSSQRHCYRITHKFIRFPAAIFFSLLATWLQLDFNRNLWKNATDRQANTFWIARNINRIIVIINVQWNILANNFLPLFVRLVPTNCCWLVRCALGLWADCWRINDQPRKNLTWCCWLYVLSNYYFFQPWSCATDCYNCLVRQPWDD